MTDHPRRDAWMQGRGATITYREVDGITMCMRNPDCLLEVNHQGLCVLEQTMPFIPPEAWNAAADHRR